MKINPARSSKVIDSWKIIKKTKRDNRIDRVSHFLFRDSLFRELS